MGNLIQTRDQLLDESKLISPNSLVNQVPRVPGYYSIWIDSPDSLPVPFSDNLRRRKSRLLYVGIASKSLFERLVEQEFQHKRAATFFRSLGAVLGYRPPAGSLVGKRNQSNYRFSRQDTDIITQWIESHLSAQFSTCHAVDRDIERILIEEAQPVLNIRHNPQACRILSELRNECRRVALSN